MRVLNGALLVVAFGAIAAVVAACPASLDDRCAGGACELGGTSGGEGGPDVATDSPDGSTTDPCIETPTAAQCLNDQQALFVSATGNDQTGAGTQAAPFLTIGKALTTTSTTRRRIYVCEGTYPEDLGFSATHSGLSLIGGVDCRWAPSANRPTIGASANPLKIVNANGFALVNVIIASKDAPSGSSVAAFVDGGDVTLKGVRLSAGNAPKGDDGTVTNFTFPTQAALNGNDSPAMNVGGPVHPATCPGGAVSTGGAGGDLGMAGAKGAPGLNDNSGQLSNCAEDRNGAAAGPATAGANATGVAGSLSNQGWTPKGGNNGSPGAPGQGGGGGYGNGGGGGSGGSGGCGGAGGGGGSGGGGSIALVAHFAKVTIVGSTLQAKNAGDGGKGVAGQNPQPETGIGGNRTGAACNGGNGGLGAAGGSGGGGIGGSSLGIVWKGTKPSLDSETEAAISYGNKGVGGSSPAGGKGDDGLQDKILEVK